PAVRGDRGFGDISAGALYDRFGVGVIEQRFGRAISEIHDQVPADPIHHIVRVHRPHIALAHIDRRLTFGLGRVSGRVITPAAVWREVRARTTPLAGADERLASPGPVHHEDLLV